MTIEEPDAEESLVEQAAALEKAGKAKTEEMKKKREEEEEEEEDYQTASSSTQCNYRKKSKRRPKKPKAALEKAAGPALEKATLEGQVRRGRRAKNGQKELLVVKEEEHKEDGPLEKDTNKDKAMSLEKDTKKDEHTKRTPRKISPLSLWKRTPRMQSTLGLWKRTPGERRTRNQSW